MPEVQALVLNFSEIAQAPEGPGIYAWYATLPVGPADLLREIVRGPDGAELDLGEQRLRDVLVRHSQKHVPPPLSISARASFQSTFSGTLHSALHTTFRQELAPNDNGDEPDEGRQDGRGRTALDSVLCHQRTRTALVKLLTAASPCLTAPIYIGTSRRLRDRLAEHAKELEQLNAAVANDTSLRDRMEQVTRERRSTFAVRATALGFSPEQLSIRILDARAAVGGDVSDEQLAKLSSASEWLLNRWHRPIAGRL